MCYVASLGYILLLKQVRIISIKIFKKPGLIFIKFYDILLLFLILKSYPMHLAVVLADFHRAVVATAPGEKLLIGRRPVRNWTQLQFFFLRFPVIIYRCH